MTKSALKFISPPIFIGLITLLEISLEFTSNKILEINNPINAELRKYIAVTSSKYNRAGSRIIGEYPGILVLFFLFLSAEYKNIIKAIAVSKMKGEISNVNELKTEKIIAEINPKFKCNCVFLLLFSYELPKNQINLFFSFEGILSLFLLSLIEIFGTNNFTGDNTNEIKIKPATFPEKIFSRLKPSIVPKTTIIEADAIPNNEKFFFDSGISIFSI